MEKVRIGCVKYLNTLPLIEGLRAWRDCELMTAVPSELIGMLRRGEVDVALASVIDAGCATGEVSNGSNGQTGSGVVLLPVGMIGCEGATLTVRLFSRVPLVRVERVAVDSDSHTSVMLLRVLMLRKFARPIETVELGRDRGSPESPDRGEGRDERSRPSPRSGASVAGEQGAEAILLIGDKVVTAAPDEREYPYQMDLGAAWRALTGLPFVYAMWMCRAGEEDSLKVRATTKMLERARLHNSTRLDWIVARHAEERGWKPELAAEYLGSLLKYDVGEPEMEAVGKFLEWSGHIAK